MRILYDHQALSMQDYGGVSRYVHEIAGRIGHYPDTSVRVFAPFYINQYNRAEPLPGSGCYLPRWTRLQPYAKKLDSYLGNLALPLRMADIFHETYYSATRTPPRGALRLLTVYDMIHELYPDNFNPRDDTRRHKAEAVRQADHIICISENTRRDLLTILDVPPDKVSAIHIGHTTTVPSGTPIDHDGQPYLLYVGARGGYKNFKRLLEAFAASRLPSLDFRLVCFGGGPLADFERAAARSLGLSDDNMRHTSGPDGVLADLYKAATAFVYPSRYEGFGIPPLEAMAQGCPVACSNAASMPEVVGEAALMFDPDDTADITRQLEALALSPQLQTRLRELGHLRAAEFTWDKCAAETHRLYSRLLGERT